MKKSLEELIKETDKFIPTSIEAGYDNYDSQEEVIDEIEEEMDHDEYEK